MHAEQLLPQLLSRQWEYVLAGAKATGCEGIAAIAEISASILQRHLFLCDKCLMHLLQGIVLVSKARLIAVAVVAPQLCLLATRPPYN